MDSSMISNGIFGRFFVWFGALVAAAIIILIAYMCYQYFYSGNIVSRVNENTGIEHVQTRSEIKQRIDDLEANMEARFGDLDHNTRVLFDRLDALHVDRDSQAQLMYFEINENEMLLREILSHQYKD